MYQNFSELLREAETAGVPLWKPILRNERVLTGRSEEEIFAKLESRYDIMRVSAERALEHPLPTMGNLISGVAKAQDTYAERHGSLCGSFLNKVMARALSCSEVNASMGRICAMPTAGSCGIVPAVLLSLEEQRGFPRRKVLEALAVASGFGTVTMQNATVAGAEGGCQAECGAAAAMAAAAAVYLADGSPRQCGDAFSIALINVMGLVCDPVAGLVQVPCAQRNASQAVNALLSADLVLAGMRCPIPPDQALEAMAAVGRQLPCELKETASGGIAATEAGREIAGKQGAPVVFAGQWRAELLTL